MRRPIPQGYTPRYSDIFRNVWIFRNPHKQSESVEISPFSVPLDDHYCAKWEDVVKVKNG